MGPFQSFVRKEFYHVFRDPKTLLLLFGLPIVQIVLFGFALTNEIKDSRIVVCDYDKSTVSQHIIEQLRASDEFMLEESILNPRQIEEVFKKGNVKLVVVFPADLSDHLEHLNHGEIQIIADASDPNTANTLSAYVQAVIGSYQKEFLPGKQMPFSIGIETRMMYNPELKGTTNYVPGVMALVLMLISVLMTSVSIVREKELGTMEILLVSPVHPLLVIVTKAIPYLFLSLINLTVILLLSVFLLDTPINGSIPLLFWESLLLIITALSLGLLISNVTASQQTAMLISLMGMLLPTIMFSGFMFPIENLPWPLQLVSNIVPAKWYYIIVKAIMIKGLGFSAVWKETLILLGMTLFLLTVSLKNFKNRLE